MTNLRDFLAWLRDTALRMLPHATRPGLYAVGQPGPDAPVLCTGNFTLTVRRMKDALVGHDAWLLVANSDGALNHARNFFGRTGSEMGTTKFC